jgi:hypothetical protein
MKQDYWKHGTDLLPSRQYSSVSINVLPTRCMLVTCIHQDRYWQKYSMCSSKLAFSLAQAWNGSKSTEGVCKFQATSSPKLQSKRTRNLETWVNTTQQTVHYLLNVNNQADDDPANEVYPATSIQIDIPHPAPQGLPTPPGSEASQVPPNTTA